MTTPIQQAYKDFKLAETDLVEAYVKNWLDMLTAAGFTPVRKPNGNRPSLMWDLRHPPYEVTLRMNPHKYAGCRLVIKKVPQLGTYYGYKFTRFTVEAGFHLFHKRITTGVYQ